MSWPGGLCSFPRSRHGPLALFRSRTTSPGLTSRTPVPRLSTRAHSSKRFSQAVSGIPRPTKRRWTKSKDSASKGRPSRLSSRISISQDTESDARDGPLTHKFPIFQLIRFERSSQSTALLPSTLSDIPTNACARARARRSVWIGAMSRPTTVACGHCCAIVIGQLQCRKCLVSSRSARVLHARGTELTVRLRSPDRGYVWAGASCRGSRSPCRCRSGYRLRVSWPR